MSSKRYEFKLIEGADAAELESELRTAGAAQWSAIGYGILPDGRRSVLMQRKRPKLHHHGHHRGHHEARDRSQETRPPEATDRESTS